MWRSKPTIRIVIFTAVLLVVFINVCQLSRLLYPTKQYRRRTLAAAAAALSSSEHERAYSTHPSSKSFSKQPARVSTIGNRHHHQQQQRSYNNVVQAGDAIYSYGWDTSPIVVEKYKLVFFTIPKAGCTVWKQLFRRMAGFGDWKSQNAELGIPHDPRHNGLTYLHNYSLKEANEIMTSPVYTRAVFVRDPKERLLSAFLDKALSNDGTFVASKCCPKDQHEQEKCKKDTRTFPGFVKVVMRSCNNPHWDGQSRRMDPKYWQLIDFVGNTANAASDAKQLLQRVGAWDDYGKTGWGSRGNKAIFEPNADDVSHATWAKWRMWQWYTPELETIVESFYATDYSNPVMKIARTKLY